MAVARCCSLVANRGKRVATLRCLSCAFLNRMTRCWERNVRLAPKAAAERSAMSHAATLTPSKGGRSLLAGLVPLRHRGDRFLRASARRLPTQRQTWLHQRRL